MYVIMEQKFVHSDSKYEEIAQWCAYIRRHNANIFDVFFKDKENISDEEIVAIIEDVALFFGMSVPIIQDKCETLLEVMTSEDAVNCELYYNCHLMEKAGINNTETLRLSLVHELSHQILYKTRFLFFENELWIQELAADMIVGAFSTKGNDVATGKYKYVLKQLPASLTHPDGKLRASIVEFGREYITKLREQQNEVCNIQEALKGLPAFVYMHYQELYDSWAKVQLKDDELEEDIPEELKAIDIESLSDTNLIKQAVLKHRNQKKESNNESS